MNSFTLVSAFRSSLVFSEVALKAIHRSPGMDSTSQNMYDTFKDEIWTGKKTENQIDFRSDVLVKINLN